jgi:Flp pilus assembly protein TadG
MRQIMRRIVRQERGAVVIELALIAPILTTMIIGVVDISNAYSQKLTLEQGAQRAIEKMLQTSQETTVDQSLQDEVVCQVNGTQTDEDGVESCKTGLITTDDVTVTDRLECIDADGTSQVSIGADALKDCDDDQTETRYVSVAVTSVYAPMFPIHFSGYNSAKGGYPINVTAGVRTV